MAYADDTTGGRVILSHNGGTQPPTITLGEACEVGDILGYSSGWKRALATTGTAIQGRLVALRSGASGDVIPVATEAVISGVSGATTGSPVYVAEGTSYGETTQTAPTTTGDVNVPIGLALSDTVILVKLPVAAYADADGVA